MDVEAEMKKVFLLLICLMIQNACYAMENILYVLHHNHKQAIAEISNHPQSNYIILAQSYRINKNGEVAGEVDAAIRNFSKSKNIKLMAMVTNSLFDPVKAHHFLKNTSAQDKALQYILNECNKYQLYGVQFDFEMIPLADKTLLTNFYEKAARFFHKNHFVVSFAVAPTISDKDFESIYQKKLYDVWQGAYDLKRLSAASDFITVMTYDQHAEGTSPGPIASILWVDAVLKHVLKFIPPSKVSLGVPTYSGLWYLGYSSKRFHMRYDSLAYQDVAEQIAKYRPTLRWDAANKVHFFDYASHWSNRFVYVEDSQSFSAKVDLARKYNLKGISVFRLGIEDPKIWDSMPG